ncbi:MAG: ABC transporter ATP-binding protein [Bacilli bacterium]
MADSDQRTQVHQTASLLDVSGIETGYDDLQILWNVGINVQRGERVIVLGANGAGKTTLLKTLVGLLPAWKGAIHLNGEAVQGMRIDRRISRGVSYLSEVGVVAGLTIEENLRIGGYHLAAGAVRSQMAAMYDFFPDLRTRRREAAASLSGGQRKMLAVAKALMSRPQLVIMDEPSAGLSPLFVAEVISMVNRFHGEGISFLVAEQNVKFLEIADRVYVLDAGRMIFSGTVEDLHGNDALERAYFGVYG